ncbi:MAG: PQQ-dependent sugar dehydrogenase [Myxococcota bacterium]
MKAAALVAVACGLGLAAGCGHDARTGGGDAADGDAAVADVPADGDGGSDAAGEVGADAAPDADGDAEGDASADSGVEADAGADADVSADADVGVDGDAGGEADADALVEGDADTVVEADADALADGDAPADTAPAELPPFSYATACDVGQRHFTEHRLALPDAFPELPAFAAPIDLRHAHDGSGRIFVAERAGRIIAVSGPEGARTTSVFLDVRAKVWTSFECGFLGMAFHPQYAQNGQLYVTYCQQIDGQTYSMLTRFTVPDPSDPASLPGSEVEILRQAQPFDNHNGGSMAFGPDGFLYYGFGDGGSGNDPFGNGQDLDTWLGKILRIDVDHEADGKPYAIPAGNPYAAGGGRAEICAVGMRNPWRMSFDRVAGDLWVGDVGQTTYEEIDRISCGKNYGWSVMEGAHCRPGGDPSCDTSAYEPPVLEYQHFLPLAVEGNSVTGGYVYRGQRAPSFYGRYFFADYGSRIVVTWKPGEPRPTDLELKSSDQIAAFGEDEAGELYLLALASGRIFRVAENPDATAVPPPPATLSATGCFDALATMTPAPGVLPYSLNLPFWSDGADKQRWVVLPDGGRAHFAAEARWSLPAGTLLIKHFARPDPTSGAPRPIETRFLALEPRGVRGWSYRWRDDGSDADLVSDGADLTLPLGDGAASFTWSIPSSAQCASCHRPNDGEGDGQGGGGALGLETRQLDRGTSYLVGGVPTAFAQIEAWQSWGLFDGALPDRASWPAPYSAAVAPEPAARAWLAVNCAFCHQAGGPSGTALDLRFATPLAAMAACDVVPARGDLGLSAARILAPGHPERSVLHERLVVDAPNRMPPLGSHLHDDAGARLVADWIAGLAGCP